MINGGEQMNQRQFLKPVKGRTIGLYSVPSDIQEQYKDLFPEVEFNRELSALVTEYLQSKINQRKAGKI